MITVNALSEVAALMGDPARAAMLQLLMDGRAHTASELALTAGVTAQTASGHLGRMVDGHLLAARAQGRNRFYRLATSDVAHAIESLMAVAGTGVSPAAKTAAWRRDPHRVGRAVLPADRRRRARRTPRRHPPLRAPVPRLERAAAAHFGRAGGGHRRHLLHARLGRAAPPQPHSAADRFRAPGAASRFRRNNVVVVTRCAGWRPREIARSRPAYLLLGS
jgi:DNA-binding transcriptional ArsR family regulator